MLQSSISMVQVIKATPSLLCTMVMVVRPLSIGVISPTDPRKGSTVARFAGQNVHKRLVAEESYKEGDFASALKRAFLGTDEDLLASALQPLRVLPFLTNPAL